MTTKELRAPHDGAPESTPRATPATEKLSTINARLGSEIDDLRRANEDIENALAGSSLAIVFLDGALNVRRYTAGAERLLRLRAQDIGLGVDALARELVADDLARHCRRVMQSMRSEQLQVATAAGTSCLLELAPYLVGKGDAEGVILLLQDISPVERLSRRAESREQQQSVVASLGLAALRGMETEELMQQIVRRISHTLQVDYCKILKYRPKTEDFLLVAGTGWNDGLVGAAKVPCRQDSQAGYTLMVGEPVIVSRLDSERRFQGPELLIEHGVVSGMSCPISDGKSSYGVLGVHTKSYREFTSDDANFMVSLANLLSSALTTQAARRDLMRSEEQFRTLANAIPQLAWRTDADGYIHWYNKRWYDFTGTSLEEVKGWGWKKVHHPDHVDRVEARFKYHIERGLSWEDTFPLRGKDGSYRWFLSRAMPITNASGEVLYWFGTNTDITDQLNYEQALHESEQRLNMAREAARIGIQDMDLVNRRIQVDAIVQQIWGLAEGQDCISLKLFEGAILAEDLPAYRECLDDALAGEGDFRCEYEVVNRSSGEVTAVEARGKVIFRDGQAERIVGTIQDVTERKQAEQTQKLLSAIVASTEDAIISMNLQGIVTSWNLGAEELFGYRNEEVVGQPISLIIPPDRRAEARVYLDRLRAGESVENLETVRITRSGELLDVSVTLSPLRNSAGVVIGASKVLRDITERKVMQAGLEEKTRTLVESNRQLVEIKAALEKADAQKNRFLAVLGHELRNPLSAISGAVELIKLESDSALPMVEVLERNIDRISFLLNDMLDLSRISLGKIRLERKVFDLRQALEEASDNVWQACESKGQRLEVELPADPVWVEADPMRIEQICVNLLTNANKYTPEGGAIRLRLVAQDHLACVTVTDDGIGLEADQLERIFEPFVGSASTRDTPDSLGIGLALVKQLTEMHGGNVEARSDGPGRGAELCFTLPRVPLEITSPFRKQESDEGLINKVLDGLPVMIVDDNPDALMGVRALLEHRNCRVEIAGSGEEVIHRIARFRPLVFILDIGMPDMSGYDIARHLRGNGFGDALLIALSGYGHEEAQELSRAAQIDFHLNKPLNYQQLLDILVAHFAGRE